MDLMMVAGLAGFATYMGSYALLQVGYMDGNGVPYTLSNITAAALVLVSLTEQFNLASLLIQVSWIAFGLIGLIVRLRRTVPADDG